MDVGGGCLVEDSLADLRRLLPFTEGGNRPKGASQHRGNQGRFTARAFEVAKSTRLCGNLAVLLCPARIRT